MRLSLGNLADRLHVAEVAKREPPYPSEDARLRLKVAKLLEPRLVLRCLSNLDHAPSVSLKIRQCKRGDRDTGVGFGLTSGA